MINIRSVLERSTSLGGAAILLIAAIVPTLSVRQASALSLTDRSLMVTSTNPSDDLSAPDGTTYTSLPHGDPRNGAKVGHTYKFTPGTNGSVRSLGFLYCNTPFGYLNDDCDGTNAPEGLPSGMSITNAPSAVVQVFNSADVQQGSDVTFTVGSATGNLLQITNATGVTTTNPGDYIVVKFAATASNYFVNPNIAYRSATGNNHNANGTYFVHINTYSDAAYTTGVDEGTVTNSITNSIKIYTRVQETLNFSVEGDESGNGVTAAGGTCAPLTESGQLNMGDDNDALASSEAFDAKSYFRLATNSSNGANVYYSGDTLKNGSGTAITAAGTGGALSSPGGEQFGLAFDAADPGQSLPGGGLTMNPVYADGAGDAGLGGDSGPIVAEFAFDTASVTNPVSIASSTGVVECSTGAIRYIANIDTDTPAGIYQTKINYIASPSY